MNIIPAEIRLYFHLQKSNFFKNVAPLNQDKVKPEIILTMVRRKASQKVPVKSNPPKIPRMISEYNASSKICCPKCKMFC